MTGALAARTADEVLDELRDELPRFAPIALQTLLSVKHRRNMSTTTSHA